MLMLSVNLIDLYTPFYTVFSPKPSVANIIYCDIVRNLCSFFMKVDLCNATL